MNRPSHSRAAESGQNDIEPGIYRINVVGTGTEIYHATVSFKILSWK